MWMANVEVPQELIDAHRRGDLVIFVGAGASMGPPSNLPDFNGLTAEIAADAGVTFRSGVDSPDVALGRADANLRVDVHARIASKIADPSSRPNPLHEAIGALAAAGPTIRIVTTNYDRHLSTVLKGRGLIEYNGPAVPMGDDFEGLVYLHGTLTQEPRFLIATDEDFGRGYLRDAWAARFLERMFTRYTVLFIGYSHSDLVMTYLARSLRSTSRRFVLTPDPPADTWRHLRIETVPYQKVGGSHAALNDVIALWAKRASMGLLDHRQQVAQLLSVPPSSVPDETSYLQSVLAADETVGFFCEHARGVEWLTWAAARPEFQRLFSTVPGGRQLAHWFAEHYVMQEEHTQAALDVVQARGPLGPELWDAIGHRLHMRRDARPAWLGPWLLLLVRDAPDTGDQWLTYALAASQWPQDRTAALLLLDYLMEPQAVFERSFLPGRPPSLDLRIRADVTQLRQAYLKIFAEHLDEVAHELIVMADGHLRRAHLMAAVAGAGAPGGDVASFGRSAIEPHPQDDFPTPIDVLIDVARDCLEVMLDGPAGGAYLHAWADSDVPLLRRLAIHGWERRSDVTPTTKITWLRDGGWLLDFQTWHEAARLVETTIGNADQEAVVALINDVLTAPDAAVDDHRKFTTLAWIAQHAHHVDRASQAFAEFQALHPNFEIQEHPDFHSWLEVGEYGDQPPIPPEEFHSRIATDAAEAIGFLFQYEAVDRPFRGPTWDDALNLLTSTVRENPQDGFQVLSAAGGDHPAIVRAVIRGWSTAKLDDIAAAAVVAELTAVQTPAAAYDLANLLSNRLHTGNDPTAWHTVPGGRELATLVWAALASTAPTDTANKDWYTTALNHPAGWLARFWLNAVAADWQNATNTWTKLPPALALQLQELIDGVDERSVMAQVILAGQLHYLHSADPDWAEQHVLPLLDWSDAIRARRVWDSFLTSGKWNTRLLVAGLLRFYLAAVQHIDQFRPDIGRRIPLYLASVAVFADDDPVTSGWARILTRDAEAPTITMWINQIGRLLADLDASTVEQLWTRWMRTYWRDRLASNPVGLTDEEASAIAGWTVHLADSVAEAVDLALLHPAFIPEHSRLLNDMVRRAHRAPAEFAALLVHLLRGTRRPFHDAYQLPEIVGVLRNAGQDVKPIIEEAVRLGRSDAPGW